MKTVYYPNYIGNSILSFYDFKKYQIKANNNRKNQLIQKI